MRKLDDHMLLIVITMAMGTVTALSEKTYVTQPHKRRNIGARPDGLAALLRSHKNKGIAAIDLQPRHATRLPHGSCVLIFDADRVRRPSSGISPLPVFHRGFSLR